MKLNNKRTVEDVIAQYGQVTQETLASIFAEKGIVYPPASLVLLAFKESKQLAVWAANDEKAGYQQILTYPVLAASGMLGPKLREGDKQVPEGIYRIIGFNPNSAFHLSMKLNYPNAFDEKQAKAEGRREPGSNIFIHGRASSVGCLAIGDPAIETLFCLVHATGLENTVVLIAPYDPAIKPLRVPAGTPAWTQMLYDNIMKKYQDVTRF